MTRDRQLLVWIRDLAGIVTEISRGKGRVNYAHLLRAAEIMREVDQLLHVDREQPLLCESCGREACEDEGPVWCSDVGEPVPGERGTYPLCGTCYDKALYPARKAVR